MKFLVIVDGNGPLAGSKLRLFSHATIEKEEGWNHELKPRPFHRMRFFCVHFYTNNKIYKEWSTCQKTLN